MYAIVYLKAVPVSIFPYFSLLATHLWLKKPSFAIPLFHFFRVRDRRAIHHKIIGLTICTGGR